MPRRRHAPFCRLCRLYIRAALEYHANWNRLRILLLIVASLVSSLSFPGRILRIGGHKTDRKSPQAPLFWTCMLFFVSSAFLSRQNCLWFSLPQKCLPYQTWVQPNPVAKPKTHLEQGLFCEKIATKCKRETLPEDKRTWHTVASPFFLKNPLCFPCLFFYFGVC